MLKQSFAIALGAASVILVLFSLWGVLPGFTARIGAVVSELLPDLSWVQWVNAGIATAGALVGLGAANRMSPRTECTIIISFFTVGAGMVGYALGTLLPDRWQQACDTVLLGGMLALLIGTRRHTIWIPPEWMPRFSYAVSITTWVVFFLGVS